MTAACFSIDTLEGFDDPRCGRHSWNGALASGDTDAVFLTWEWQKAWWESFERRGLMLLGARRNDELAAVAPFFSEGGMVYFVGSGGSDYLDFVGDIRDPGVLDGFLDTARARVDDFIGFQFFHVRETSQTARLLGEAASRLNLVLREEGSQNAPAAQLSADSAAALVLTQKKSLVRHEGYFRRSGSLNVAHSTTAPDIEPHLDAFFQQHIGRWQSTPCPSLFNDPRQQRFYRTLTRLASDAGWLRFTRVDALGQPIAFHYGFAYGSTFLWYKPSFAIELARHSPGEVLLRQLLLRAIDEGMSVFDFGLGDEAFKARFATTVNRVRNWGLYPADKPLPEIWQ